MSAAMLTTTAYAEQLGKSVRTVQRLVKDGRLPGVVEHDGVVLIPADAVPVKVTGDAVATSPTSPVSPPSSTFGRPLPPGLWTLREIATYWDTTTAGVRELVDARPDAEMQLGRFGRGRTLRVYVAPR